MRTTPGDVQKILGANYDDINCPSLDPYIRAANLVISRVVTCATGKGVTLSTEEQREMEKWVAAHFYTINDPIYKSKQTANSSASYFDRSYLDAAKMLDTSGCLAAIVSGQRASLDWLGLAESEQTDYVDRN